jgi:hypothetical protein
MSQTGSLGLSLRSSLRSCEKREARGARREARGKLRVASCGLRERKEEGGREVTGYELRVAPAQDAGNSTRCARNPKLQTLNSNAREDAGNSKLQTLNSKASEDTEISNLKHQIPSPELVTVSQSPTRSCRRAAKAAWSGQESTAKRAVTESEMEYWMESLLEFWLESELGCLLDSRLES